MDSLQAQAVNLKKMWNYVPESKRHLLLLFILIFSNIIKQWDGIVRAMKEEEKFS